MSVFYSLAAALRTVHHNKPPLYQKLSLTAMNPAQFIACCFFAVFCMASLHRASKKQADIEMERIMKEVVALAKNSNDADAEPSQSERLLTMGLETVHWVVTLKYLGDDRDLGEVVCNHDGREIPLKRSIMSTARSVGMAFMKTYSIEHNISLEHLQWEIAPLPDEEETDRRMTVNSGLAAPLNEGERKLPYLNSKKLDFVGKCHFCNPENGDNRRRLGGGGQDQHKPPYLSALIAKLLMSLVKQRCIPDLESITFEMAEESSTSAE